MRRTYKLNVTHVMANGREISDVDFFAEPYAVVAEENYGLLVKCSKELDCDYAKKERLRRKFIRVEDG